MVPTALVQLFDPFVPLSLLVVAIVAFIRSRLEKFKVKIDGWTVIGLAALVTFGVCVWMQRRVTGAVDWMRLGLDAPAVFILAVGGTSWLQKLQRDGAKAAADAVNVTAEVEVKGLLEGEPETGQDAADGDPPPITK